MKSIKLANISFDTLGIRKLKNINLRITDRITLIAGHNAIGKSTILGIISNCSGLKSGEHKSYFDKTYQSKFEELFYLDSSEILPQGSRGHAILNYRIQTALDPDKNSGMSYEYCTVHTKKCNFGKNTTISSIRPRLIPRSEDREQSESLGFGSGDAKIPLPTIYLGMSRMTPIGEFEDININKKTIKNIDSKDKQFIYETFNKIIRIDNNNDIEIVDHDFKSSKKRSKIPAMNFNTLSISLGQDSVSAIVTALASFNKLKREQIDYIGGILVIDEIESGLHPRAQINLMNILKKLGRELNLQIIATTHSLTIIKSVLKDQEEQSFYEEPKDSVIYLQDTRLPHAMQNPTYEKIKNDMLLSVEEVKSLPCIKVYFEDKEALFFFKNIVKYLSLEDDLINFGRELDLKAASLGCDVLLKLNQMDEYFQSVLIILDNDVLTKSTYNQYISSQQNIITLPGDKSFTSSTQPFLRNPENIIYCYLLDKLNNYQNNIDFWQECSYTTNYVEENILTLTPKDMSNNELMKSWFNKNLEHFEYMSIIGQWCAENDSSIQKFKSELFEALSSLR